MSTVTVWKFDTPHGADEALSTMERLHSELLLQLHDAAVVNWEPGHHKPKTRQLRSAATAGALGGAFWGLLFGIIFFVPLLGLAIGAAGGALFASLRDVGISDAFINDIRTKVTPGTSALFALTSNEVFDKVARELRDSGAELIRTNLSDEQEHMLREAFAEEEDDSPAAEFGGAPGQASVPGQWARDAEAGSPAASQTGRKVPG